MDESLQNIALQYVAKYMKNGTYKRSEFKIHDTKMSQTIFKTMCRTEGFTEISAAESIEKLKITEFQLPMGFTEEQREAIYGQNLITLELRNLEAVPIFHDHYVQEDDGIQKTHVDIYHVLTRLLNPESRRTLRHLSIQQGDLEFTPNWTRYIHILLPNLDSLVLDKVSLNSDEFERLCDRLQNLTKLELHDDPIADYASISKLKNLEILLLPDTEFQDKEELQGIFELKKLRVLDIGRIVSTVHYSNNFKFYMECKQCLPELRFLGCMQNDMNLEELEKLIDTHPKLEIVCLLETPLEKIPAGSVYIPENRSIKLQTFETIETCMEVVSFSMKTDRIALRPLVTALEHMTEFVKTDMENLNHVDWEHVFQFVSDIYLKHNCTEKGLLACLLFMLEYIKAPKQTVVKCSLTIPATVYPFDENNEYCLGYRLELVRYQLQNEVEFLCHSHLDNLCKQAAECLLQCIDPRKSLFQECLKFLGNNIDRLTPEQARSIAEKDQYRLLMYLSVCLNCIPPREFTVELYQPLASVIFKLLKYSKTDFIIPQLHFASDRFIRFAIRKTRDYNGIVDIEMWILEIFKGLLDFVSLNTLYVFVEKDIFKRLLHYMNISVKSLQESMVSFLISLNMMILIRSRGQSPKPNHFEFHRDFLNDAMEKISKFPKLPNTDGDFFVMNIIRGSGRCRNWATDLMSIYERVNGPEGEAINPKKFRVH
ncbi:hypothetical protein L5515_012758 [Caenorhabditis briggsae]|uniref:Uncharacterized protein n=2 Tax=Caenorhabditis briggsae TaxID=6238 RepID=A0AAE9ETI1_CAEBR|nr:hypothetical protein L5515_012758 [Caenorhabditis briggsae]